MSAGASVYTLFIVSKSGSTVFFKGFRPDAPQVDSNDQLRVGSEFYGMFAIASSLSLAPNPTTGGKSGGIVELQADAFKLRCFQTPTGMKFVLLAEPHTQSAALESLLAEVYRLYADFVLKDPNYDLEQPIRLSYFSAQLEKLFASRA